MKMNPVVHFELSAEDRERAADFYTKVFGWEAKMMGEDYGNYVTVMTTESDEKGPKKPGAINGGLYPRTEVNPSMQQPSVVISVDNLEEYMKKVKEAGGKILGEPMDIPKVGRFVSFRDPEGNRLSILESPKEM